MPNMIEIIGFLVLLYTVYLIITENSKKGTESSNQNETVESSETKKDNKEATKKYKNTEESRRSVPAQKIEDDGDADVLKQGKGYTEQEAFNHTSNQYQQYPSHMQEPVQKEDISYEQLDRPIMRAPSSKYSEQEPVHTQPVQQETVSVICPYCDNKVLVPRGGNAECSCCSSILNDTGGIMESQ